MILTSVAVMSLPPACTVAPLAAIVPAVDALIAKLHVQANPAHRHTHVMWRDVIPLTSACPAQMSLTGKPMPLHAVRTRQRQDAGATRYDGRPSGHHQRRPAGVPPLSLLVASPQLWDALLCMLLPASYVDDMC